MITVMVVVIVENKKERWMRESRTVGEWMGEKEIREIFQHLKLSHD